ncbi:hypothetical protein JCM10212_004778 [Sporobolomyces blumeae]
MPSIVSTVSLALLALSPLAVARPTGTRPEVVKRSRETPSVVLSPPNYKAFDKSVLAKIEAMAAAASASAQVKSRRALDSFVNVDALLVKRDNATDTTTTTNSTSTTTTTTTTTAATCLDSSATDVDINAAFYYGGAGTTVNLCPGAKLSITNPIFFTAANQVLTTQGNPTDDSRALLTVTGDQQSCAIYGACDACHDIVVRSIQVDGARDKLGYIPGGLALLEMGGNAPGQTIQDSHLYEPRGWSVLHGIEGYQNQCRGMVVKNNQVGPSGYAPNNGAQFKRATDWSANVGPGEWADGISMACGASTVTGNTVTDCTDGGIVVFGAEGSTISGNTVIASNRRPLGGINMVDWAPWGGSFTGTTIEGNTIIADTNMIKVGIAVGGMVWGSDNRTAARTFGGAVRNNVFKSGSSGYFGYAIAVAGHNNGMISGNDASGANFGGNPSAACIPSPMVPTSQALVYDQWTTPGTNMQNNMQNFPLVFLICQQPGSIVGSGMVAPQTGMMLSGQAVTNSSASSSSSSSLSSSSSSSSTTTTTTTTTTSSTTTITTTSSPTTTTTTTTSAATTTTSSGPVWVLVPTTSPVWSTTTTTTTTKKGNQKPTTTSRVWVKVETTTTTTTTAAAERTRRPTWKERLASTEGKRSVIIQDGDDLPLEKRSPTVEGYSKSTPVVKLVNPFDLLEKTKRQR